MEKISDLLGADPYPAEEPQTKNNIEQIRKDYSVSEEREPEDYPWYMNGTHLWVGEDIESGLDPNKPYAYGNLSVSYNWDSVWHIVYSNMNIFTVEQRIRKYAKQQGWQIVEIIGPDGTSVKISSVEGIGDILPGLKNWRLKEWSGTAQDDNPGWPQSDKPYYGLQDPEEAAPMSLPRICTECGAICMDYDELRKHMLKEHVYVNGKPDPTPIPVVDLDDVLPADFNVAIMDTTVQRQSNILWKIGRSKTAAQTPMIPGPIPFIYDIEKDRIYVGQPGERHADIKGRFTPGGIVEGTYDPKGNVQIRTDTDMPYTVRHLIKLWYYLHPELEVKNVYLLTGEKKYKLAQENIGQRIRILALTYEIIWTVFNMLSEHGDVYIVGSTVRDLYLGRNPREYNILVRDIEWSDLISLLGGNIIFANERMGIIRYRLYNDEITIMIPHIKYPEIFASSYLPIEDYLEGADFSVNAIAVDLSSGRVIDPYNGVLDLNMRQIEVLNHQIFIEDPEKILEIVHLVSEYAFNIEQDVLYMMAEAASGLVRLKPEVIGDWLDKIIAGDDPARAITIAEDTGVMYYVLPEFAATYNFNQRNKYYVEPLNVHIKDVLRLVSNQTKDPDVRWAALLHDIGKPASQWIDQEGMGHYYRTKDGRGADHEIVGSDMARSILERLQFPKDRIDKIKHLIRWHMLPAFSSESGAKEFINSVGQENIDDMLILKGADINSKGENPANEKSRRDYEYMVQYFQKQRQIDEEEFESDSIEPKQSHILDPIKDTLSPEVFEEPDSPEPKLRSSIRTWIINRIYETLVQNGWPDPEQLDYVELVLTGSLTTYQWSEDSDLDISLWIRTEALPEWVRADLITMMVENCDGIIVPGTSHPLQVFVVDTRRFNMSDLYKPGMRSAYHVNLEYWIVPPERERAIDVYKNYAEIISYAKSVEDKIRLMLRYNSPALKPYFKFIKWQRRKDMLAGKGDYATSNIVYKWLQHVGLFPHIEEATGIYIA